MSRKIWRNLIVIFLIFFFEKDKTREIKNQGQPKGQTFREGL